MCKSLSSDRYRQGASALMWGSGFFLPFAMLILAQSDLNAWGIILGACIALGSGVVIQVVSHLLTNNREQIRLLREAYANYGSAAFAFLLALKQWLNAIEVYEMVKADMEISDVDTPEEYAAEKTSRRTQTREAYDRIGLAEERLNGCRGALIMVLGNQTEHIDALNQFHARLVEVRQPGANRSEKADAMMKELDSWFAHQAQLVKRYPLLG